MDDQDAFTEYLIEQNLWNSVLKENFRAQYKMIESDLTRNIEDLNICFRRSEMLKNLTLLALKISSEVKSFEPIAKRVRSSKKNDFLKKMERILINKNIISLPIENNF